ncbi:hypothetical protein GOV10_03830, partial [Candidatus Woesearchaeota archaeon]|nr:hypothetical protein [Candidatus Woesearchaeota archaeon]
MFTLRKTGILLFASILLIVSALFTLATVTMTLTAPSDNYTVMTGTYDINVTHSGETNISIIIYNGSDWVSLNTSENETTDPYTYAFTTGSYVDYSNYLLNVTATNYSDVTDFVSVVYGNLSVDNDAPFLVLDVPFSAPLDGENAFDFNVTYVENGTNVTSCNWTFYNDSSDILSGTYDFVFGAADRMSDKLTQTVTALNFSESAPANLTVWCQDYSGNVEQVSTTFGYDLDPV